MTGRIDVHAHLLPGVDDGCKSVAESVECARMLASAGYSHAFCTPHVWPNNPSVTAPNVMRWTAQLQQELDRAQVRLVLAPGGELNLNPQVMEMPPERIISCALRSRFVLTDIWADELPDFFEPVVRRLQRKGLKVILAHPERCRAIQQNPNLAGWLEELGILLQGNLQCLSDPPEMPTRRVAEQYLRQGRYFLLGSDTHNPQGLAARLAGLRNAIDMVGEAAVNRLTIHNPRELL